MNTAQNFILTLGAAYIGGALGSFLHVCHWRIPRGQDIVSQPSRCPFCDHNIPWHLNQPIIGWLLAGRRCAHCKTPIPARYLTAELACAALFLLFWFATTNLPITGFGATGIGLLITTILIRQKTTKLHKGLTTAAFVAIAAAIVAAAMTLHG